MRAIPRNSYSDWCSGYGYDKNDNDDSAADDDKYDDDEEEVMKE